MAETTKLSEEQIRAFSSKKVLFGHQSVGTNIIEGIEAVLTENGSESVAIASLSESDALGGPGIIHFEAGENTDPVSKIAAFTEAVEQKTYENADVALLKFCYVDFDADTDVDAVFSEYSNSVSRLKELYPDTAFVHITSPLTTVQKGPKAIAKRILGRDTGIAANVKREEYNQLVRETYKGKEPVFDIALVEATKPDGKTTAKTHKGSTYYSLVDEYTSDGGHLNETGKRIVGAELIKFIAELPE